MAALEAAQRIGGRGTTVPGATGLYRFWRADPDRVAVSRDDLPEPGEAALEMDAGGVPGEEGTREPLEDRLRRA